MLILPATAVVTDQMLEFTQLRVAMRRQHFAVGVDINARAFGLFQQVVEIFEIVPENQNAFTRRRFDVDLGWRRVPYLPVSPASRMLITLKFIWPISIEHSEARSYRQARSPSHAMIL
ncbi:Uncharacterised protein [Escherichia coli]|nr:Uncharacterised protein [Escherichia coli]